ncbi:serine/arginine repetitive matrix protein 1 [Tachysurus fulvidraco]|uniref:serine/arginine repetitive matrix protein 1 n=1 Tax=Tachysurus fulvidraco TaxID=1234273 RepID=UPI000F4F9ABC|nr:serine/arginine repetitive matrix protein 1 [Tachysurus fulvidraco]XP_047665148.1 serine/arginine repetitive matrix protein 1 [Tachysurus fulvidraco]
MVRPHSGSPRSRQRSFSDSSHSEHHGGRLGPASRGFRGPPGKASPSWRGGNSRGHSSYPRDKRPMMGEHRPHGHWMPQNQDNFRPYPMSQDSQRGRRRSSPSRSNHPPPFQHRHSPHGSSGPHRPFHGNHSGHVSPSSRYFHSPPSDRRGPSPHNTFRAPQRYQNSPHEQERNFGPGRQPSPRERPLGRMAHRGHRWNGPGAYAHPNGESRPYDSPQRKPREFHERNSYPERWSTERDPRKQRGDGGKGRGRGRLGHHAPEWPRREGGNPYPRPPYRSPSWKSGPMSSSNSSPRFPAPPRPQDRPPMRPMKRRIQDMGRLPPELEHGPPKRLRREMPARSMPLKGFGGRCLSLKDKSRLLKGRKFRAESVTSFKMPPPRPRPSDNMQRSKMVEAEHVGESSRLPPRKIPLKKSVKRQPSRESPTDIDSKSPDPEMDSETQVESRRSVRARSSSPIDRQLTHDLVVVSHWEAGTRSSSPKSSTSWKSRMPHHNKTGENPGHRFGSSARDPKQRRLMDGPAKMKPGPFQKPGFRPAPALQKGSDGVIRRPLMAPTLMRPSLNQKPVFRKSQSIMNKYRNMQTLRHKAPPHPRQATSYRRW